jgi:hypothetical protein
VGPKPAGFLASSAATDGSCLWTDWIAVTRGLWVSCAVAAVVLSIVEWDEYKEYEECALI